MTFLLCLFSFAAAAAEGPRVDASSLPAGWHLRDSSEFVKLGSTPQRLVYQPKEDVTPLASVQIITRPLRKAPSNDVRAWTAEIIHAQGEYEFLVKPKLSREGGRRVYRAEVRSDSDTNMQHYLAVEAIEVNGNLLIMFVDQTRDSFNEGLPAVRALFARVRAK